MGCGESKHAVATENAISKSKSKNSINSVEEKENLIKEPGVDVEEEEEEKEKENAKVIDNGKGESRMKEKENSEEGKEKAILTDNNGNGKSERDLESVKEKEEKLVSAPVVIVEGNKSDEISVHHQVQEPEEEEKLKRENAKIHLNDDKEDSKTEEAVEEEKEVMVLPIAETKDSATNTKGVE